VRLCSWAAYDDSVHVRSSVCFSCRVSSYFVASLCCLQGRDAKSCHDVLVCVVCVHHGSCLPPAHLSLTLLSIFFTASRAADTKPLLRRVVEPAFEVCDHIARFCALTTDTTLGVVPLLRAACAMTAAVASMATVAARPTSSLGAGLEAGGASVGGDKASPHSVGTRPSSDEGGAGGDDDTAAPSTGTTGAAAVVVPVLGPTGPAVTADALLVTVAAGLRSVVAVAQRVAASTGSAEAVVAEVMAAAVEVVGLEAHSGDRAWLAALDAVVQACLSPSVMMSPSSAALGHPHASVWGRLSQLLCLVSPRITSEPIRRIVSDVVNIVDAWRWGLGAGCRGGAAAASSVWARVLRGRERSGYVKRGRDRATVGRSIALACLCPMCVCCDSPASKGECAGAAHVFRAAPV
jgi:hypothetical protein